MRPPSRPNSSQSNPAAPPANAAPHHPFGSPPFDPHMGPLASPGQPLDRFNPLGPRRGSEDLNPGGPFQDGRGSGLGGAFGDPPRDGARPFGMGMAAGGTTESMLRDIWARPLAGSQSQAPSGPGASGAAQMEPSRSSVAGLQDFRAAMGPMGVGRQGSGPFAAPFGAGESPFPCNP